MKDYLVRGIDKLGQIRVFVASTTNLAEEGRLIHDTSPTATAAFGRCLTAGVIMGAMMKNEGDVLTLKIAGDGPVGNIYVVANNAGKVKGTIDFPMADVESRADGKLDVGSLVGKNGTITTIMDLGLKEPYVGQGRLVSGEIAEDLVNLYMASEQQPTAINLGVLVDTDISCRAAGGYMIQLMPGISEEDITKIETSLSNIEPISTLIDKGFTPEEIIKELLGDFDITILDKLDIEYKCDCNRDKIEKVLISLGKKEIEDMIIEDGQAEVVCHFCNIKYHFTKENLANLLIDN